MGRADGDSHLRSGKAGKNPIFLEKRVYQGSSGRNLLTEERYGKEDVICLSPWSLAVIEEEP